MPVYIGFLKNLQPPRTQRPPSTDWGRIIAICSGFCRGRGLEFRLKSFPAIVLFSFLLLVSSLLAAQEPQDKDADKEMQATPAAQANTKNHKKDHKQDLNHNETKTEPKE